MIRFIFDSICAHKSYRSIIRECNDRWGKEQKIFFYESSIYHIAKQPLYAGYQYNSDRELIKNTQITGQEIITFDQWQQAQEIVSDKRKNYRTQEKKRCLPLSGRLFCGSCGSRLVVFLDHGDVYYACNKRTLATDHRQCSASRIRYNPGRRSKNTALYDAVYPLLTIALFVKLQKYGDIIKAKNEINDYEAELKNMQKIIDDTYELISNGLATMADIRNILLKQKSRKDELQKKITEAKASCVTGEHISELESSIFKDLMLQIIDKSLSDEKYAELVGIADIRGTVYRNRVDIHTAYGEFSLPRIFRKNYHCMPESRIVTDFDHSKEFNGNTKVRIIYRTGDKKVLVSWGRLTIETE